VIEIKVVETMVPMKLDPTIKIVIMVKEGIIKAMEIIKDMGTGIKDIMTSHMRKEENKEEMIEVQEKKEVAIERINMVAAKVKVIKLRNCQ